MKLNNNINWKSDFWEGTTSDIAFLLIIFFILTAIFSVSYVLKINTGDGYSETVKKSDLITVEILDNGEFIFNGNLSSIDMIGSLLSSQKKYRLKIADSRCYQEFVDLLNIFYEKNINKIEVVTK